MLVAYGKTFGDVAQITDEQLRQMIAYPGGETGQPAFVPSEDESKSPRDLLLEQVLGSTLKAHGKGRKQLVDMTDEELKAALVAAACSLAPARPFAPSSAGRSSASTVT